MSSIIALGKKLVPCHTCKKPFLSYSHSKKLYCSKECFENRPRSSSKGVSSFFSIEAPNASEEDRKSHLFGVWLWMHKRCSQSTQYVKNGIVVCEEWRDWLLFKTWALNNGYRENLSLDRILNPIGYEPANCRFIHKIGQQRNKRVHSDKVTSIYKGIYPANKGWKVESRIGGKWKYLGTFDSEIQAAQAYDDYVFSIDPECSHLNFPERLRPSLEPA